MVQWLCLSPCKTGGRRFDPGLLQPVGWDYKPKSRLHMTLAVGGTLNTNQPTFSSICSLLLKDLSIYFYCCVLTLSSRCSQVGPGLKGVVSCNGLVLVIHVVEENNNH